MKRVAFHTLGCKLNYAETATVGRQFVRQGFQIVDIDHPADVVVINTCSVTEKADRECRQVIRRALRHSPSAYIAVIGCYAQLQPKEISSIEGVDLVLGTREKFNVLQYIGNGRKKSTAELYVSCPDEIIDISTASSRDDHGRTRVFLKIQDGCNYNCSFCTIPIARGKSRSVNLNSIVSQAVEIAESGYKEIVLTGVNVGDYDGGNANDLISVLREIVKIDSIQRIRISSIELNLLTDELLELWFTENKLCKHWHIPLQSGSDEILKKMRRRYSRDLYRSKIEKIKSIFPYAGIGADVIVGFPTESENLFAETYDFLSDIPVTYLHVFSYSERPNTLASTMNEQVPITVRAERSELLRNLSIRKKRSFYETFHNRIEKVLFETKNIHDEFTGLTEAYMRVEVHSTADLQNKILPVRIERIHDDHCEGIISSQ